DADAEKPLIVAPVPARDGLTTEVVRSLDAAGVAVTDLAVSRPSLNDVFLALTGHGAADGAAGSPAGRPSGSPPLDGQADITQPEAGGGRQQADSIQHAEYAGGTRT